jgi:hypothetical protein
VSVAALPDGRILYWNGLEGSEHAENFAVDAVAAAENSRARILDLRSGEPQFTVPTLERGTTADAKPADKDMFCSDQRLLYDGTVLIAGGTEWRDNDLWGDHETRIFDPSTDTFVEVDGMDHGRWYPSLVTLPDGRVLAISGVRQLINTFRPDPAFSQVKEAEIFDPETRTWSAAGTSPFSFPLFARVHLLPSGKVFYGGLGQTWNPFGETADEATWGVQRLYDPSTGEWELVGAAKYGARGGAFSVLLRLEPPYDTARVLMGGGTLGPAPGSFAATTISEVVTITGDEVTNEPGSPKAPLAGELAGDPTQLRNARWFSSGVLLPTGEVLALSGGDTDGVVDPGSEEAVRMAELYDPATNTWRELSEGIRDRTYHNTAVLLADGRVLVGGHSPLPAHYQRHDNPLVRSNNFKDATFEIYSPPYLSRGPRPEITSVHGGNHLVIELGATTDPETVTDVVLTRIPTSTHVTDADQRAVELELTGRPDPRSGVVVASLPNDGDGRIVPPGPYYLFVLSDTGQGPVPSVAKVVFIEPAGGGGKVIARTN